MAKTWDNVECEFFTGNTENAMGDSKYLILADKMTRTALINFDGAAFRRLHPDVGQRLVHL